MTVLKAFVARSAGAQISKMNVYSEELRSFFQCEFEGLCHVDIRVETFLKFTDMVLMSWSNVDVMLVTAFFKTASFDIAL